MQNHSKSGIKQRFYWISPPAPHIQECKDDVSASPFDKMLPKHYNILGEIHKVKILSIMIIC